MTHLCSRCWFIIIITLHGKPDYQTSDFIGTVGTSFLYPRGGGGGRERTDGQSQKFMS
jgi:hypothetical protein